VDRVTHRMERAKPKRKKIERIAVRDFPIDRQTDGSLLFHSCITFHSILRPAFLFFSLGVKLP
jgi:hypothetical protein